MSSRSHRSVEPDDSTASEFSLSHPEFPPSRHQLPVKIETRKLFQSQLPLGATIKEKLKNSWNSTTMQPWNLNGFWHKKNFFSKIGWCVPNWEKWIFAGAPYLQHFCKLFLDIIVHVLALPFQSIDEFLELVEFYYHSLHGEPLNINVLLLNFFALLNLRF